MDAFGPRHWMTQIRASAPHYEPSPCYIRISKHRVAYFPLGSLAVAGEIWGGGGVVAGQKPTGPSPSVAMPSQAKALGGILAGVRLR